MKILKISIFMLVFICFIGCSNTEKNCNGHHKNCNTFIKNYEKYRSILDSINLIVYEKYSEIDIAKCQHQCFELPISIKEDEQKIGFSLKVYKDQYRCSQTLNNGNGGMISFSKSIYQETSLINNEILGTPLSIQNQNELIVFDEKAGYLEIYSETDTSKDIFYIKRRVKYKDGKNLDIFISALNQAKTN